MTLNIQFFTMISMVLGGFYLGIMQDTFRRVSIHWKKKAIIAYFMEICFWLSQTMVLFYVLFRVNDGELRVYVFAACLLGFSAYQALAASHYKRLLERIIQMVNTVLRFAERLLQILIVTPVKFIIHLLMTMILFIVQICISILLFLAKVIFYPIRSLSLLFYRLLPKNIQKIMHKIAGFYSIMKNICIKCLKHIPFKRR